MNFWGKNGQFFKKKLSHRPCLRLMSCLCIYIYIYHHTDSLSPLLFFLMIDWLINWMIIKESFSAQFREQNKSIISSTQKPNSDKAIQDQKEWTSQFDYAASRYFYKSTHVILFYSMLTNSNDITSSVLRGGGLALAFWIPLITRSQRCVPSPPQRHSALLRRMCGRK